jgi:hypothetical protein
MRFWGMMMVISLTMIGCGGMPRGPSTAVYVGNETSFEPYQPDAEACRDDASTEVARASGQGIPPAVKTGAVTGILGAATGAAIGSISGHPGRGAAIGAATGVTAGAGIGAVHAGQAGDTRQKQFDTAYGVCRDAKGHRVPGVIRSWLGGPQDSASAAVARLSAARTQAP